MEVQIYRGSEESSGATFFTNQSTTHGCNPHHHPALSFNTFICLHFHTSTIQHVQRNHTYIQICAQKKCFIQYIETLASLYIQQLVLVSTMCRFTCRSPKQNLCHCPKCGLFFFMVFFPYKKSCANPANIADAENRDTFPAQGKGFCLIVFMYFAFLSPSLSQGQGSTVYQRPSTAKQISC